MEKVKIQVNRKVSLPYKGVKKTYRPGVYEFEKDFLEHWFIKGLIKSEGIYVLTESKISKGQKNYKSLDEFKKEGKLGPEKIDTLTIKGPEVPNSMKQIETDNDNNNNNNNNDDDDADVQGSKEEKNPPIKESKKEKKTEVKNTVTKKRKSL
jgi:hypothetical protein